MHQNFCCSPFVANGRLVCRSNCVALCTKRHNQMNYKNEKT
jgi:hypothetical protein